MLTVEDRYDAAEVADFHAAGLWSGESLYDEVVAQAQRQPDKGFVFDSTHSLTFGELCEQSLRIAVGLHRLGVRRGDRVVVQLPNWVEFTAISVAITRIGAILVPVLPIYRRAEVDYIVRHSEAVLAFTPVEFRRFQHAAMFRELASELAGESSDERAGNQLRQVVAVRADGEIPAGVLSLDDVMAEGELADLATEIEGLDAEPDEPFLIMYTSGTTSFPKGCLHTLNTIRSSVLVMARSFDYTEDDVQFGPAPIVHAAGMVHAFLLPLINGASCHLMEVWDPAEALRRIEQHRITTAAGATTFLEMMLTASEGKSHDLTSLRYWACAGSPIPEAVIERAAKVFPRTRWLSVYGRSENVLTTMTRLSDPPERAVTSDGIALDGTRVEIVGPDGVELPRGEEGDITYKGPSHMLGYFKDPAQTDALFTPSGQSRSGDLGRMDANGFVRVTGRLKDIVVRGGMNISAQELEGHLAGHPRVSATAVVSMPDQRLGEKVCVYAVAKGEEPLTLDDINAHLRGLQVATQKLPEHLEVIAELPITPTGKVQKHLLRADIREKLEKL